MATRRVTVRLIDLGLDEDAGTFAAFVNGVVGPFARRSATGIAPDIELVRTRELATVLSALTLPAHVLHVVGHVDASADFIGFNSGDERTVLTIEELLLRAGADGAGAGPVTAAGVIIDAAKSGSRRFVRAVRSCISRPTAFIGAPEDVSWPDSTLFGAAFYAAFLDGPAKAVPANVMRAADRARNAARATTGRAARLRGELLTPR